MKRDYELIDAEKMFSDILSEMMVEEGLTYDKYSPKELHGIMAECCSMYQEIYDLYLLEALYGHDKQAKTRFLIRFCDKPHDILRKGLL